MSPDLRRFSLVCLATTLASFSVFAETYIVGTVEGEAKIQYVDGNGKPVRNETAVNVLVQRFGEEDRDFVRTDVNGRFTFYDVPQGRSTIKVPAPQGVKQVNNPVEVRVVTENINTPYTKPLLVSKKDLTGRLSPTGRPRIVLTDIESGPSRSPPWNHAVSGTTIRCLPRTVWWWIRITPPLPMPRWISISVKKDSDRPALVARTETDDQGNYKLLPLPMQER